MFHRADLTKLQILFAVGFVGIAFLMACNGSTPVVQVPTDTPAPVDTPVPTKALVPPTVTVSPGTDETLKPGDTLTLRAEASGGGHMTYQWELVGKGSLSEETDKPAVIYTAPESVEEDEVTAVVSVTVRNEGGETTKGITISIVNPTPTPTATPTSTPTNTPTPTSTPIPTKTPTKTPTPTNTPGTTEEPTVTITITEPKKEVECPEGEACIFTIKGTSTGVAANSAYRIVPFVNPSPGNPEMWWPQWERLLGSDVPEDGTWRAEARIGTDEGVDPDHRFEIAALVMEATAEIPLDFQSLPESIAQSNIVTLVTIGPPPPDECPFIPPFRTPIEGPSVIVEASITSIENCADNLPTAAPIPLRGTYSGDMTNKELWVLVYPPNIVYYPQSTDACRELPAQFANGQWAETIRLGREGVPEAFHIVLVVTEIGSPASQDFHSYLRVGCDTESYDGRTLIPPGATELDSIIVHTK